MDRRRIVLARRVGNCFRVAMNERSDKEGAGDRSSPLLYLVRLESAHLLRQVGMAEGVLFILGVVAITMIRRDDVMTCEFVGRCVWALPRQETSPMKEGGCVQFGLVSWARPESSICHRAKNRCSSTALQC